MLHRIALLAAVFIAASVIFHSSTSVFAGPNLALQSDALLIPIGHRGVFLGCVWTKHQCSHRAHDSGYHHHRAVHDHYACHHGPSYACYAW